MGKNKISKKERERLAAEAKKKEQRSNRNYFIGMAIVMLLIVYGVGYLFNGAALKTLPDKNDVTSIAITDTRYTDEACVLTSEDDIKNACTVMSVLRVKYGEVEMTEQPMITVVYQLEDGTEKELLLGEETLRWEGKDYTIKQRGYEMFLEVLPVYFFPEYVTTAE